MTDKTNKIDNNVKTCKINEIDIIDLTDKTEANHN